MDKTVILYQFQLCPFCHKVRAALELKGVPYQKIEVSPGNKKELPELPEGAPRKVPILQVNDRIIWDSTDILKSLDELVEGSPILSIESDVDANKAIELEDWIDEHLIPALPTVLYATWKDAFLAAKLTATGSNYSFWKALQVRVFGSIIMKMIAKRILRRHNRSDGRVWVKECVDYLEGELAQRQYLAGENISLADAAFHGALSCVQDFPLFNELMTRPIIKEWFDRIQALRVNGMHT